MIRPARPIRDVARMLRRQGIPAVTVSERVTTQATLMRLARKLNRRRGWCEVRVAIDGTVRLRWNGGAAVAYPD